MRTAGVYCRRALYLLIVHSERKMARVRQVCERELTKRAATAHRLHLQDVAQALVRLATRRNYLWCVAERSKGGRVCRRGRVRPVPYVVSRAAKHQSSGELGTIKVAAETEVKPNT